MYIPRKCEQSVQYLLSCYPIVSVTGPRQCGKSTMVQNFLKQYHYINLDDQDILKAIQLDPVSFLENSGDKIIIDEAQYYPEIFNVIKLLADKYKNKRKFVLTGSQNFLLSNKVQQSLAGRVGINRMLPLSFSEINSVSKVENFKDIMIKGGYPRIYNTKIKPQIFYRDYVSTYVQRDVRELLDVRNMEDFRKFLFLLAHNSGNLLNYSSLAKSIGINTKTAKSWLSILSSSYITFLLNSYSTNIKTRTIKAPKVYFYDTGLLCYLLGVKDLKSYELSQDKGKIFENFIISEIIKKYENKLIEPRLSFLRDSNNCEIDLIDESDASSLKVCEIKSSAIYHEKYKKNLKMLSGDSRIKDAQKIIIYSGKNNFKDNEVFIKTPDKALE